MWWVDHVHKRQKICYNSIDEVGLHIQAELPCERPWFWLRDDVDHNIERPPSVWRRPLMDKCELFDPTAMCRDFQESLHIPCLPLPNSMLTRDHD
ncbi:hypothetical protein BLOT_011182 [Blomia tropicalis]|nr:hypothetical protein BLOT_011182 [Blomia tropicalis]